MKKILLIFRSLRYLVWIMRTNCGKLTPPIIVILFPAAWCNHETPWTPINRQIPQKSNCNSQSPRVRDRDNTLEVRCPNSAPMLVVDTGHQGLTCDNGERCGSVTAVLQAVTAALCLCWGELIAYWILHIALHACSHAVRPELVMKRFEEIKNLFLWNLQDIYLP